jgi:predicted RNase H-like nuclease
LTLDALTLKGASVYKKVGEGVAGASGVDDVGKVSREYSDKIMQQMKKRGWTEDDINRALSTTGIPTIGKKGTATRYVDPKTGKSLVVDDSTGEIFHVGKPGYKYDY